MVGASDTGVIFGFGAVGVFVGPFDGRSLAGDTVDVGNNVGGEVVGRLEGL
jgi:hypothetical protein